MPPSKGAPCEAHRSTGSVSLGAGSACSKTRPQSAPSTVAVRGSLIQENHEVGVFVQGSDATLETSVVTLTQPDGAGLSGLGVSAQMHLDSGAHSTLIVESSIIDQNRQANVAVLSSTGTIRSSLIRDALTDQMATFGDGVVVISWFEERASALVSGTRIERSARAAVAAWGEDLAMGGSLFSCQAFDIDYEHRERASRRSMI